MSFVIAAPELMEAAAHDLAGIGSSLGEATNFAAAPTTSIAAAGADEVSVAIAALFGNHGQEFQALSAQAAAFHNEFVGLMKSGAGAYLNTEVANAEQMLGSAVTAPARALGGGAAGAVAHAEGAVARVGQTLGGVAQKVGGVVTALESQSITGVETEVGALTNEFNTFGATVAAPYQSLFANTSANLQSLGSAITANPQPLLRQIFSNQAGYAQRIDTGFLHTFWNLHAELANLPGDLQTGVRALSSVNPAALVQHSIANQIGYAQTISTSVGAAAHDFTTGLRALPASFQTAFQDLAAGNTTGAVNALASVFGNLFITGFNVTTVGGSYLVTPTGALGDLLPILAIPGEMAQNFTNLLPASSIAHLVSQNFTNVIKTVTDTSVTSAVEYALGSWSDTGLVLTNTVGLPLVLGIEALGGPVNALNALGHSATSFINAVQAGNGLGAADALIDAPANMANAFLNGHGTLPLTLNVEGLETTVNIPLDGILTSAAPSTADILGFGPYGEVPVFGTPIGGIVPGLLHFLPEELAAALGGPAPLLPPPPVL